MLTPPELVSICLLRFLCLSVVISHHISIQRAQAGRPCLKPRIMAYFDLSEWRAMLASYSPLVELSLDWRG